jgi:hypothetical protein
MNRDLQQRILRSANTDARVAIVDGQIIAGHNAGGASSRWARRAYARVMAREAKKTPSKHSAQRGQSTL